MRALLGILLLSSGLVAGCCKKEEPKPTTTTVATTTPVTTATVKPCSGMTTLKDCQACCNPQFYPGARLSAGKCDCGAKR